MYLHSGGKQKTNLWLGAFSFGISHNLSHLCMGVGNDRLHQVKGNYHCFAFFRNHTTFLRLSSKWSEAWWLGRCHLCAWRFSGLSTDPFDSPKYQSYCIHTVFFHLFWLIIPQIVRKMSVKHSLCKHLHCPKSPVWVFTMCVAQWLLWPLKRLFGIASMSWPFISCMLPHLRTAVHLLTFYPSNRFY